MCSLPPSGSQADQIWTHDSVNARAIRVSLREGANAAVKTAIAIGPCQHSVALAVRARSYTRRLRGAGRTRCSQCRFRNTTDRAARDGDHLEAAPARRLDRTTRQMEPIERHVTISNEALADVECRCRLQKFRPTISRAA